MSALIAIALASAPVQGRMSEQAMDHAMHHTAAPDTERERPDSNGSEAPPETGATPPTGTDQPVGSAEPPPIAHDRPGDRFWDPAAMAAAAQAEMHPPQPRYAKLLFDLAEHQFREGREGYRWEGEAWFGDLDRIVIKSKGEGTHGAAIDHAEVQALYAKALDPWWNLQIGVRQDIRPQPARTWATLGLEGRAPYQFAVQVAAFLSDKGQLTARMAVAYDQRLTQRLIVQPRAELELSAQDMPTQWIGAGLATTELGLRVRYEIRREFAPYLGMSWTWANGRTADYARASGQDTRDHSLVAGIRCWF